MLLEALKFYDEARGMGSPEDLALTIAAIQYARAADTGLGTARNAIREALRARANPPVLGGRV
jgi:hypothetical protein